MEHNPDRVNTPSFTPLSDVPIHDFSSIVHARHSTRVFLPNPIPQHLLEESLSLASLAPSNSNIQPWRMYFASGACRDRLRDKLISAASSSSPAIPPLPPTFSHFRSELGRLVYGESGYGIPRDDTEAHKKAVLRNYGFFGAPLVGFICMDRELERWDAMTVGMYMQTLVLALTERRLSTCLEVSLVGYEEIVREELGIPAELMVLCGVAVGYADPEVKVNKINPGRVDFHEHVVFRTE